jgi:heme-degrading monooxygenase HmoA
MKNMGSLSPVIERVNDSRKEKTMAVKVLITRKIKKTSIKEAYKLLMELRSLVTVRPGYVSGETLFSADDPYKLVVISTWINRKRWKEWRTSDKRKEYTHKIEQLLEGPEQYEVFLAGEREPEWVDMA